MKSSSGSSIHTNEHVDPVFDGTNTGEPKIFDIIKDVLSLDEAASLLEFLEQKLPVDADEYFSIDLSYRPEDWDSFGIIEKIYNKAKAHISEVYPVEGSLNPRRFQIVRTDDCRPFKQEYGNYRNGNEILYTAVVTPVLSTKYFSGETLYFENGEGFRPSPTDLVIHRNERINSWEIIEVLSGARYDLIITFEEVYRGVSYDYEIAQLEYGDDF